MRVYRQKLRHVMRIAWKYVWVFVALVLTSSAPAAMAQRRVADFKTEAGDEFSIDTSEAPDLTDWTAKDLAPVIEAWYPKIVKMLPSEGFAAPRSFRITFSATDRGVAATRGTAIECGAPWFRGNLKGEAKGAVVHELVHVAQQYKHSRGANGERPQTPGWLVEEIGRAHV